MGYYITLNSCSIRIPESDFPRICQHLLTTGFLTNTDCMSGGSYSTEGRTASWYSWVDMDALEKHLKSDDLPAVLEDFGFDVMHDDEGAIDDLCYDSKSGNEEELFDAMAPAMSGITELFWTGECGAQWKWVIKDGELRIIDAVITYPED
jgi:hypothetical protein